MKRPHVTSGRSGGRRHRDAVDVATEHLGVLRIEVTVAPDPLDVGKQIGRPLVGGLRRGVQRHLGCGQGPSAPAGRVNEPSYSRVEARRGRFGKVLHQLHRVPHGHRLAVDARAAGVAEQPGRWEQAGRTAKTRHGESRRERMSE